MQSDKSSGVETALPEFARAKRIEEIFGLKRGYLYTLLADGVITGVSLKRQGKKMGVRLFYIPSIRSYLLREFAAQNSGTEKPIDASESRACTVNPSPATTTDRGSWGSGSL